MRTTLSLAADVLRQAKARAARDGTTLSALVEQALRDVLREKATTSPPPFVLPTYRGPRGRRRVGHTPAELHAALELEDRGRVGG